MNIRCGALVIAVILTSCANDINPSSLTPTASRPPLVDLYHRGDGQDLIKCMRTPDRDVCASDDELGYQFSDCSSDEFDCVFDYYNVFAVPKQGLVPGQEFNAFGARLTVERCFGDTSRCSVAMISSTCASDAVCSCRIAEIGKTRAIFYYSSELGITAFYTTAPENQKKQPQPAIDAELDDAIPLRMYVLTTGPGFLREHWKIRAAKFQTQCQR
jgi:hypothetical protein